ncbi:MAG: hypothetical protein Q9174_002065 [Haloplaca sp. 1 TL-2023]
MDGDSEDQYFIPLQDQKVFGAGVSRKKVNFVPSRGLHGGFALACPKPRAGDRYLSIVLKRGEGANSRETKGTEQDSPANSSLERNMTFHTLCEICKLPVETDDLKTQHIGSHESSIAHQACLPHSHPPSHLDRTRQGLKYLSNYGWDPDSRRGLGATGTGIRIPVKAKPKYDSLGIGVHPISTPSKVTKQSPKKLDAKKTRKAEEDGRRARQQIQNMFYENEDVKKYLGGHG